jgi:nucleotide-binding universal stress UspA family protein
LRVVIAYDGSSSAEQAVTLVGALRWPLDVELRIVSVVRPILSYMDLAGPNAASSELRAEEFDLLRDRVARAAGSLTADGRRVEGVMLQGRPATVLVDDVARSAADLVVVGSRGHGQLASLLLGSVAAEVTDRAACPVLIARTATIEKVVLAVDGSAPAAKAESLLATWPIFDDLPIHVLSVADVMEPVQLSFAPIPHRQAAAEHAAFYAEAQERHTGLAVEAAARLRAAGRRAEPRMRIGGAGNEIVKLAAEVGADLVVVGSRGRSGLARAILGSVARDVLHGSRSSVLIVRDVPDDQA